MKISLISGGSSLFATFINIPIKLLTIGILGPVNYGLLRIFALFDSYITYGELGSRFGLNREIPVFLGVGNKKDAQTIANLTATWVLLVVAVGIILLWGVFLYGHDFNSLLTRNRLILISATLVVSSINRYAINYAIGYGVYKAVGGKKVVGAISPILMLIPVYYWNITGAVVGLLIQNLTLGFVVVYFINKTIGISIFPSMKFTEIYNMLRNTNKYFAFSTISHLYIHVISPSILILKEGINNLGLLTFAEDMRHFAQRTMNGAKVVVERKMFVESGKITSNKTNNAYDKYFGANYIMFLLLSNILLGFSFICYRIITDMFIVEFMPGLNAGLLIILASMLTSGNAITNSFLLSRNLIRPLTIITLIALAIKIILLLSFLSTGSGLMGVAFSTLGSGLIYAGLLNNYVFRIIYENHKAGAIFYLKLIIITTISGLLLLLILSWKPTMVIELEAHVTIRLIYSFIWGVITIIPYTVVLLLIYTSIFHNFSIISDIKQSLSSICRGFRSAACNEN